MSSCNQLKTIQHKNYGRFFYLKAQSFCFTEPEIPDLEEENEEEKAAANDNGSEGEASAMERVPTRDGGAEGAAAQDGAAAAAEGHAADAPAVNPETGEETMLVLAEGGQPDKPETPKLPATVSCRNYILFFRSQSLYFSHYQLRAHKLRVPYIHVF